jgi:hypothetical protein
MNQPDEIPRFIGDADERAVILLALAEALGGPYEVRLIGDRENWVSVEVVGRPQP